MDESEADPRALDFDLRGIPLHLWDHGGTGRRVLILHGFLDSGRSWDAVAAALQPDWRALCLDWRGHGASGPVPPGASFHQLEHLEDLCLLLDALDAQELGPEVVLGHSLGGIVGCLLAGSLPHRIERLVLVDSLGALPEAPEEQPARLQRLLERVRSGPAPFRSFDDPEAAAARVQENNPGLSREGARRMVRHLLRRDADGRWRFRFDARLRGPSPVRHPEAFWRALLARITARVHVVVAEHGLAHLLDDVEGRYAALDRATREVVEGVGHHIHLDRPEAVACALPRVLDPA